MTIVKDNNWQFSKIRDNRLTTAIAIGTYTTTLNIIIANIVFAKLV